MYLYGQSKCCIEIIQTEVGLEAGSNLMPVMEDKEFIGNVHNTQYAIHRPLCT